MVFVIYSTPTACREGSRRRVAIQIEFEHVLARLLIIEDDELASQQEIHVIVDLIRALILLLMILITGLLG